MKLLAKPKLEHQEKGSSEPLDMGAKKQIWVILLNSDPCLQPHILEF